MDLISRRALSDLAYDANALYCSFFSLRLGRNSSKLVSFSVKEFSDFFNVVLNKALMINKRSDLLFVKPSASLLFSKFLWIQLASSEIS